MEEGDDSWRRCVRGVPEALEMTLATSMRLLGLPRGVERRVWAFCMRLFSVRRKARCACKAWILERNKVVVSVRG